MLHQAHARVAIEPPVCQLEHRRGAVHPDGLGNRGPGIEHQADEASVTAAEIEHSLDLRRERLDQLILTGYPRGQAPDAADVLHRLVIVLPRRGHTSILAPLVQAPSAASEAAAGGWLSSLAVDQVRLAELCAATSLFTDLGMGQPAEHGLRTCLVSMRLADALGIGADASAEVFYVTLLRFLGCTADAHEVAALAGGDEVGFFAGMAPVAMGSPREELARMVRLVGAGQPLSAAAACVVPGADQPQRWGSADGGALRGGGSSGDRDRTTRLRWRLR